MARSVWDYLRRGDSSLKFPKRRYLGRERWIFFFSILKCSWVLYSCNQKSCEMDTIRTDQVTGAGSKSVLNCVLDFAEYHLLLEIQASGRAAVVAGRTVTATGDGVPRSGHRSPPARYDVCATDCSVLGTLSCPRKLRCGWALGSGSGSGGSSQQRRRMRPRVGRRRNERDGKEGNETHSPHPAFRGYQREQKPKPPEPPRLVLAAPIRQRRPSLSSHPLRHVHDCLF